MRSAAGSRRNSSTPRQTPCPVFALEDCQPVSEDAVSAPVRWTRPLTDLASQPVHIEFVLQNAQLFAFELLPPER
jgi:hypothetical protein